MGGRSRQVPALGEHEGRRGKSERLPDGSARYVAEPRMEGTECRRPDAGQGV